MFWDLNDFTAPAHEPVDDLFAIVVRVTNLQRFVSKNDDLGATGGSVTQRRVELTRQGPSPDLDVSILQSSASEPAQKLNLDVNDKPYRYDDLSVVYTAPPSAFGFGFRQSKGDSGGQQFDFDYYGSAQGGRVDFFTTAGASLHTLDLAVFPVPPAAARRARPD